MHLRLAIIGVLVVGCAASGADDDFRPDVTHTDTPDADAPDPGTRPDGITFDSPFPDGYGLEVGEGGDACIHNACGGCSTLRASPGQLCGGCGGTYACNGPEDVRCVGGCSPAGCADNTREGFVNLTTWPEIAACGGGFSVAGILHAEPACGRAAGNTSVNPNGTGCSAADLCADGWGPCSGVAAIAARTTGGVPTDWPAGTFFAAAVSGPASDEVCGIGENDVYGIGSVGGSADRGTCAPLTRTSGDKCGDLPAPWDCGEATGIWQYDEATKINKPGPGGGGVLCCLLAGA